MRLNTFFYRVISKTLEDARLRQVSERHEHR